MKAWRYFAVLAPFAAGAALGAAASPSAYDLAGRYTHSFKNGDVSGAGFTSTNRVVVIPLGRNRAYFDVQLNFFNGHQCGIGGTAAIEGRALVYRDPDVADGGTGSPCTFRIWREGRSLRWSDGEATCTRYCGARGSLRSGRMDWSSRRPIPRAERARLLREYARVRDLP